MTDTARQSDTTRIDLNQLDSELINPLSTIHHPLSTLPVAEREAKLYRRSLRSQWQANDLPWHLGVKLKATQRKSGARVLSQVLYGEKLSLEVLEQLLAMVAEPEARHFLLLQARDELRHIEVLTRYIEQGLQQPVQTPGEALAEIGTGMLATQSVEEKLLSVHILLEGMALEIFKGIATAIDDPLLQALLRKVARDESRHVAFGVTHARQLVASLNEAGLARVGTEGGRFAVRAAEMVRAEQATGHEFGVDLRKMQAAAMTMLFRRLQQIGLLNTLALF